ncbi:hypothetical protein PG984_011605 [Apiospora sp. TS-2023a]
MSPYQTQQSSLPRRPNYLNTSSLNSDPVASTGDEFKPYTDSSGSEFVPSLPLLVVPSVEASEAPSSTTTPATTSASTQQSGSTASSSRQRRSDAPSASIHSASSAAESVIYEDPASPRPNHDAEATPERVDSSQHDVQSSSPAREPLVPIVSGNATLVDAAKTPSRGRVPEYRTIRTVVNGKTVPSMQDTLSFLQQFEEDENEDPAALGRDLFE